MVADSVKRSAPGIRERLMRLLSMPLFAQRLLYSKKERPFCLSPDHPDVADGWIDVTKSLGIGGVRAVTKQIRREYSEVVTRMESEGVSAAEAHRQAMTFLGDARAAHDEYRRVYLTVSECDYIAAIRNPFSSILALYVLAGLAIGIAAASPPPITLVSLAAFALVVLGMMIAARHFPRVAITLATSLFMLFGGGLFCSMILGISKSKSIVEFSVVCLLLVMTAIVLVALPVFSFRLCRKLENNPPLPD